MHLLEKENMQPPTRPGYVSETPSTKPLACDSSYRTTTTEALCALHGAPVQRIQEFGSLGQRLSCLGICEPMSIPLVLLRPRRLLLLDGRFEEMVRCFWGGGRELVRFPLLGDKAEIVVDLAYYAGFFPGFALGSLLSGRFVRLPSTFGEHPAAAASGLDEKHVVLVG